jgi:hypothetical protein
MRVEVVHRLDDVPLVPQWTVRHQLRDNLEFLTQFVAQLPQGFDRRQTYWRLVISVTPSQKRHCGAVPASGLGHLGVVRADEHAIE